LKLQTENEDHIENLNLNEEAGIETGRLKVNNFMKLDVNESIISRRGNNLQEVVLSGKTISLYDKKALKKLLDHL